MEIKPGQILLDAEGKVNHCSRTVVIVGHKGPGGDDEYWTCYCFHPYPLGVLSRGEQEFNDAELLAMEYLGFIGDVNTRSHSLISDLEKLRDEKSQSENTYGIKVILVSDLDALISKHKHKE